MFAIVDNDSVIWGVGETEDAAKADARDWLDRNSADADLSDMQTQRCSNDLANAVKLHGGQVRWEWSGIDRVMELESK